MDAQFWIVGLSNTVHLLCTVLWIGWSALLALVVAPRADEAHREAKGWIVVAARRLPPLAYGALASLGATGMIQMSTHPQYEGMFTVLNSWSRLLLAKHLLILVSITLIFYLAQSISPRLRLAIRRDALGKANDLTFLINRFRLLAWLNFISALAVLLLTGFMTAL